MDIIAVTFTKVKEITEQKQSKTYEKNIIIIGSSKTKIDNGSRLARGRFY